MFERCLSLIGGASAIKTLACPFITIYKCDLKENSSLNTNLYLILKSCQDLPSKVIKPTPPSLLGKHHINAKIYDNLRKSLFLCYKKFMASINLSVKVTEQMSNLAN